MTRKARKPKELSSNEKWQKMISDFCLGVLPTIEYMDADRGYIDQNDFHNIHYCRLWFPYNENKYIGGLGTDDFKKLVEELRKQDANDLTGPNGTYDAQLLVHPGEGWEIGWNICEDGDEITDEWQQKDYNWEIKGK